MEFQLTRCRLRPFRLADARSLAGHMNDRAIWRNLRDRVPHPYTEDDAREFMLGFVGVEPQRAWAIDVDGAAVGGIGLHPRDDVYRCSMEVGFWIGRAHQGLGIVSEAVPVIAAHAFDAWPDVVRLTAEVFGWNAASARVLEKSGFVREGVLRRAVTKDGVTTDLWVYGLLRP